MNNKLLNTYFLLMIAPFFFGCTESVKEENKINATASSVPMGQKFIIDTQESVVTWIGATILASKEEHVGYVHISKGELMIEKNQLVGGIVTIDMNTIEYGDKKNTNTPVNHLKSPDYFDVEKFPISTIVITRVDSVNDKTINIAGNLTIKGVTRPVNFPAEIEVKDGIVKANGNLTIDRTDWGIRYRSGKFYDIVADEIVMDDIEFHMKIVAKNK